jgi:hypothetical protein
MDGHGEFHHAKVRSKVTTRLGDVGDEESPDLACKLLQLLTGELAQVLRVPDCLQESQRPLLRVVDVLYNSNALAGTKPQERLQPRPVDDQPGL